MAEMFLRSFSAEGIITKAASLATEPLSLAWGFKEGLTRLHHALSLFQNIFGDAAVQPEVSNIPTAIKLWVENFQDIVHDADDVLDEINYEILRHKLEIQNHLKKKVLNFFSLSNTIAFRLKMRYRMKNFTTSLVNLWMEASSIGLGIINTNASPRIQTTSFQRADAIIVRRELSDIVTTLTSSQINQEVILVMAIVGMGGIGKTTLVRSVYNEDSIDNYFQVKVWVCVAETFDVDLILSRILQSVVPIIDRIGSREAVLKSLKKHLAHKRFLLILDDVWNEDSEKWSNLMRCLSGLNFARGSSIIVTTRSAKVAAITGTLPPWNLGNLSEDECWSILKHVAFVDSNAPTDPRLEEIGREIARKCRGVPSVAKALGSMLRSKSIEEWLSIKERKPWESVELEQIIMTHVKSWFHNLKSPLLKQFFTYFSVFKKDCVLERDNLIQLWMAQGLLHPSPENIYQEMEDVGNEYFSILVESSLFQDFKMDDFGIVSKCKMHDLVHDFAQFVSKTEILTCDSNDMDGKVKIRHAAHVPPSDLERISAKRVRGLRSLFSDDEVPSNLLPRFRALHVLNLYEADIQALPSSLGKLKQLRYLNVSGTEIEALPKSIGKLHSLQTLRMQYCRNLKVFPKEVQDLVNLRHIYFDHIEKTRHVNFGWYREFPIGIRKLTNLRTIPYFIVGRDQRDCGLEELDGLNQLRGELTIYDLEHVRDGEEAKKASLVLKPKINKLKLVWGEERRPTNNNEEDVLKGLQPHSQLETLEIQNFMGAKFPSWMPRINNLRKIRLLRCDICEEVPILGRLPNLMHLEFDTMCNLKRLGAEFHGYNNVADASTISTEETKLLFPALKTLKIFTAQNLIEWIEAPVMPIEQIVVFPCLEELVLFECPQLRNVPNHLPSLRQLDINMCHELSNLPSLLETSASLQNLGISSCGLTSISMHGLGDLRKLVISSCGELKSIDLQGGPDLYTSLEELCIKWCRSLESFPNLRGCTSLREFTIADCDGLTGTEWSALESCTSLRKLHVQSCQNLRHLADVLDTLSVLEELTIMNCPSLEFIPTTKGITCLRELVIEGCEKLSSLPSWLTSLQKVTISGCPHLTSIDSLCIKDCQNLKHSSGDNGIQTPASLEELKICDCPNLRYLPTGLQCLHRLRTMKIGKFWAQLDSFPDFEVPSQVKDLQISGWPKLKSLPQQIQHFTSLTSLTIESFDGVEAFPEWFGNLTSLTYLRISRCKNLMYLPSMEAMYRLTRLQELFIYESPLLKERCTRDGGPEWPKISHIPNVRVG